MANYDKVKIVVVGDSGVGKTSAVHLLTYGRALLRPSWTVGVSLEVKLHEFRGGTPLQKQYLLELWDVGGSSGHRNSRGVFYNGVNGIILCHDLSNRKSEDNLHKWLMEICSSSARGGDNNMSPASSPGGVSEPSSWGDDDFDPEVFLGSNNPPVLVIGTKLDTYSPEGKEGDLPLRAPRTPRPSNIAQECGAEEIFLNCQDPKSLSPGSTAAVKLARFFDRVIDRRFYNKGDPSSSSQQQGLYDRRKYYPSNTNISTSTNMQRMY